MIMIKKGLIDKSAYDIYKLIRESPGINLTSIASELKLPKGRVYHALRVLEPFLLRQSVSDEITIPLPNLPIFYSVKEGTTDILVRGWIVKRKLLRG